MDDDFALAEALLGAAAGEADLPAEAPEPPEPPQAGGGGGEAEFELAAALLAAPAPRGTHGFARSSAATAMYARRCREAKAAKAEVATLKAKLAELAERLGHAPAPDRLGWPMFQLCAVSELSGMSGDRDLHTVQTSQAPTLLQEGPPSLDPSSARHADAISSVANPPCLR